MNRKKKEGTKLPPLRPEVAGSPTTITIEAAQRSVRFFCRELKAMGNEVSRGAKEILKHSPDFRGSVHQEFDLFYVTTAQLVGMRRGTTEDVYEGARRLCLIECVGALGPELRRKWQNQPNGTVVIGMRPTPHFDEVPGVLVVEKTNGVLRLSSFNAEPKHVWSKETIWLFAKVRKVFCSGEV